MALQPDDAALWEEYSAGRREKTREKIVKRYLPLVKYVTARMAVSPPSGLDYDDLLSFGVFGGIFGFAGMLLGVPVFAVGGVTPENLVQWIKAGCAGAGLGSDLYRAGQPVERTAQQAAAFVKAYQEAVQ